MQLKCCWPLGYELHHLQQGCSLRLVGSLYGSTFLDKSRIDIEERIEDRVAHFGKPRLACCFFA